MDDACSFRQTPWLVPDIVPPTNPLAPNNVFFQREPLALLPPFSSYLFKPLLTPNRNPDVRLQAMLTLLSEVIDLFPDDGEDWHPV